MNNFYKQWISNIGLFKHTRFINRYVFFSCFLKESMTVNQNERNYKI